MNWASIEKYIELFFSIKIVDLLLKGYDLFWKFCIFHLQKPYDLSFDSKELGVTFNSFKRNWGIENTKCEWVMKLFFEL